MATCRMPADTSVSCPHPRPKFRAHARARRPPRAASSARARYPRASLARGHARVPARGGEYPRRGLAAAGPGAASPSPLPPRWPSPSRRRPVQGQRAPPPHPPAVAHPGAARPPGGCPSRAASPSRRWSRGGGWGSGRPWRRSEGAAPLGARPRAGGGGSRTRDAGSWGRRGAGRARQGERRPERETPTGGESGGRRGAGGPGACGWELGLGAQGTRGLGGWGLRLGAWDWESPSRAVGVGEWSGGWELGNPKNSYIYSYIWAHMSAGMRVCGFGY